MNKDSDFFKQTSLLLKVLKKNGAKKTSGSTRKSQKKASALNSFIHHLRSVSN